ncbi:hypothetical protein GY45DRAFT_1074476 [Cubamyces sp. BRFM 1775]|nr:hypothetical protein GY45DRAFT_1074476 [Cubamyces sp. BRFM 1775]
MAPWKPVDAAGCNDAGQSCPANFETTEAPSVRSEAITMHDGPSNHSLDDLAAMDIFSGPNDDVDLVPLVDLWISELGDHLKSEDFPDPQEMYAEFDQIAKIVKEARIRSYAALTAPAQVSDDESIVDAGEHRVKKRKYSVFGPTKHWGGLRARAKRMSSRIERVLCLPYLLLWP